MVIPPVMAQLVRAIGGPTGPYEGVTGPAGRQGNVLINGATGPFGLMGAMGLTGPNGLRGLDSLLFGPTGQRGPKGSVGYPGPQGVTGTDAIVPPEQFVYLENTTGIIGIPYGGGNAGCKFYYTPKHSGILFVAFSGLVKPDDKMVSLSVVYGVDSAPDVGVRAGAGIGGGSIHITAPNMAVPFFLPCINTFGFQRLWFDISAATTTAPFDFAAHGSIVNINCVIMEF